jgi:UDP-N-acetylmuramate--alanine ligase
MDPTQPKHFHLVGIGGAGMSGIATVLLEAGHTVTGSDISTSRTVARLRRHGARIAIGHDAANVDGAQAVVYSTAIPPDNVELEIARAKGLPLLHRADMLAQLMQGRDTIAVAGTHGKTTTTSMLGVIFAAAGRDPTLVVGGEIRELGTNARLGQGRDFIIEACESDRSFLKYSGCSQVITNIEADHLDNHGDLEGVCRSFEEFMQLARPDGFVVINADSPCLVETASRVSRPMVRVGLGADVNVGARNIHLRECCSEFDLLLDGVEAARMELNVPGEHNVSNALAASAAALQSGVDLGVVRRALRSFRGARRRFEIVACRGNTLLVDDYAHHPTELRAVLRAARRGWGKRLLAIFQPHLYSRTRFLLDDFAHAFQDADVVFLTDIYASREQGRGCISIEALYERMRECAPDKQVVLVPEKERLAPLVLETAGDQDMILTLGAGDVRDVAEQIAALWKQEGSGGQ